MPLRDHFRPPLDLTTSWEGLHGQWPAVIVQQLRKRLPPDMSPSRASIPGRRSRSMSRRSRKTRLRSHSGIIEGNGGAATAVWAPARPSVAVETTLPDYDEYEVRIYDARRGRHLVAAIEIVSPANKDRPEHRNVFVARCAALLQKGVAVSIVDLVTVKPLQPRTSN